MLLTMSFQVKQYFCILNWKELLFQKNEYCFDNMSDMAGFSKERKSWFLVYKINDRFDSFVIGVFQNKSPQSHDEFFSNYAQELTKKNKETSLSKLKLTLNRCDMEDFPWATNFPKTIAKLPIPPFVNEIANHKVCKKQKEAVSSPAPQEETDPTWQPVR